MTHIRARIRTHLRALITIYFKVFNRDLTKVLSMAILRREEDEEENEIL
jgi:hypothetical protein